MNNPKRLQRSRKMGWRKPKGAVIVDRTSRWGNPFCVKKEGGKWRITDQHGNYCTSKKFKTYEQAAHKSVRLYGTYIHGLIEKNKIDIKALRGKDLICFCALDKPCHADYLLEIANMEAE